MRSARTLAVAGATAALLSGGGATVALAKPKITMSGSTSIAPLMSKLIPAYLRSHKKAASFSLLQGGSDIGISDVARGRVTIGNSSRDLQPSDPGGLTFSRIARDGVCIVTNPGNKLGNLNQEQVQAVFSGRVRSWSDVPGAKVSGTIDLITRSASSGTQDAFKQIFLGPNLNVAGSAQQKASNGLVAQSVASNRNAIGYVSFDFVKSNNAVAYKGVACNLRNAKSGQYGGTRNFYMVTRGAPKGAAGKFISWVRTSSAAKKVISTNWVPR